MKATFENLTFGAKVLITEQPSNHHLLRGTLARVDAWNRGSVRVITKFPNGELCAKWQPYYTLELLPERSKHV